MDSKEYRELKTLILSFRDEMRVSNSELALRIERVLVTGNKPMASDEKKKVPKKNKEKKVGYSNTMFWWRGLYMKDDPYIADTYTDADVKKAEQSVITTNKNIRKDDENYKRAIGNAIWKSFDKSKRFTTLKTMFGNWSNEQVGEDQVVDQAEPSIIDPQAVFDGDE